MNLTSSQQNAIIQALVIEMKGKFIAYGANSYNATDVYEADFCYNFDQRKTQVRNTLQIGNGHLKVALVNSKVLNESPLDLWTGSYIIQKIDYSKLLAYQNGQETILKATEILKEELINNANN
jgi:hypothetical protein